MNAHIRSVDAVGLDACACIYWQYTFFCVCVCAYLCLTQTQDYLSASSDLQEVLQLDPNVREAEQELEVVTSLLRQSLMDNTAHTPRVKDCLHAHTL